MLISGNVNGFDGDQTASQDTVTRAENLTKEISNLEQQARVLIRKQMTADEGLQDLYDDELRKLNERIRNLKASLTELERQAVAVQHTSAVQQIALTELAEISLESFWQQDSTKINQTLHRLFGNRRLVILNGDIVGIAESIKRQRRH